MTPSFDPKTFGIVALKPMKDGKCELEPTTFERQMPGPNEIAFDIKYCGVCHSDVHQIENPDNVSPDHGGEVVGHELAGIVTFVGDKVKQFKVGDKIGVGCMVDSCQDCEFCDLEHQQYCEKGCILTYGSEAKFEGRAGKGRTRGGYSNKMVIQEKFAIRLPESLPLEKAGPIMCAGITVYDPLTHWKAGSEHVKRIGIVGGGGLGHMGIKIAKAMGCTVTSFTTSPDKAEHLKKIGADHIVISTNEDEMKAAAKTLDLILNPIPAHHDVMNYVNTLRPNGTIVQLGLVGQPMEFSQVNLIFSRTSIAGSLIGGIKATQEVVDLCAREKIYPDTKLIKCSEVQKAFEDLAGKSSSVQRYVIDMESMAEYQQSASK